MDPCSPRRPSWTCRRSSTLSSRLRDTWRRGVVSAAIVRAVGTLSLAIGRHPIHARMPEFNALSSARNQHGGQHATVGVGHTTQT
jgi:hypothetical protein